MQEKGNCKLTDAEVDEVFSAVDTDGDKNTLTKEGILRISVFYLCNFLTRVRKQLNKYLIYYIHSFTKLGGLMHMH